MYYKLVVWQDDCVFLKQTAEIIRLLLILMLHMLQIPVGEAW